MAAEQRRGPSWAWKAQAHLEDSLPFILTALATIATAGALAYAVTSSWPWLCSWWGPNTPYQGAVIASLATGIFTTGVAAGYILGRA